MAGREDPDQFLAALHRCDTDGPLQWELTLLHSAETVGVMNEIDEVEKILREWVEQRSPGSPLADRFAALAALYRLPIDQLIQRIIEEPSGSPTVADIQKIMSVKPIETLLGFHDWFLAAKTAPPPLEDGILRILEISEAKEIHGDLLVWILTAKETEGWRTAPNRDISQFLRNCLKANRSTTSKAVGDSIKQIADSEDRTSDWQTTARHLLSLTSAQKDPTSDISWDAGRTFVWLAHLLDDEPLLLRGIECWGASLQYPWTWIGDFVDASQFSAVAALARSQPDLVITIDSGANPASSEKPQPLSYFRNIERQVAAHCDTDALRALVSLIISAKAEEVLRSSPEKAAASRMVLDAIDRFKQAKHPDPAILQGCLSAIAREFPQHFTLVTEKLIAWSGHDSIDAVLRSIPESDEVTARQGDKIWTAYLRNAAYPPDTPALLELAESMTRGGAKGPVPELQDRYLGRLLGLDPDEKPEDDTIREVLTLVVNRWCSQGPPSESLPWMYDRIRELQTHDPVSADHILDECYEAAAWALGSRTQEDAWRWYIAATDPEISGDIDWPERIPNSIDWESGKKIDPALAAAICEEALADHPLQSWIARQILEMEIGLSKKSDTQAAHRLVAQSASTDWLRSVVTDLTTPRPIDPTAFEKAMSAAPAGARRHFVDTFFVWGASDNILKSRSTWLRELDSDQRFGLFVWAAGEIVTEIESGQVDYERTRHLFENLSAVSEAYRSDPRFITIATRLQACTFKERPEGLSASEAKLFQDWQARTSRFTDPRKYLVEDWLTNEAMPITERVWKLAANDRLADAARLMVGREDDLTFQFPPDTSSTPFFTTLPQRFPPLFPEGSELRVYVEAYIAVVNAVWKNGKPHPWHGVPWPRARSEFEAIELRTGKLAEAFEATPFQHPVLEKNIALQLGNLRATRPKIIGKLTALRDREDANTRGIALALAIAKFEASLSRGDYGEIALRLGQFVEHPESIEDQASVAATLRESIIYHLWRGALFNQPVTSEQRELITAIATQDLYRSPDQPDLNPRPGLDRTMPSRLRIQALDFALAIIDLGQAAIPASGWPAGLDPGPYSLLKDLPNEFLWQTSIVLASRCQHWSEEARWNLIAMLQAAPSGVPATQPLTTFSAFAIKGFIREDEGKRRLREFTLLYPQNGNTALQVVEIGKLYKDPELERFGRDEAAKYQQTNPAIQRSLATPPQQPRSSEE